MNANSDVACEGTQATCNSPRWWVWLSRLRPAFGHVRLALAVLLLFAAVMNAEHVLATSVTPFRAPTMWLALFEFAFAVWLASGMLPRMTWWLSLSCFTLFAIVAAAKTLRGDGECGCFGTIGLSPVAAIAIDCAVVASLLWCRDRRGPGRRITWHSAIAITCLVLVVGGYATNTADRLEMASGISIFRNNAIVDTSQWNRGDPFPLFPYIDLRNDLAVGEWTILLLRPRCKRCQALCAELAAGRLTSLSDDGSHFAIVTVASSPDRAISSDCGLERVPVRRLTGAFEWIVNTPVIVRIANGAVVDVEDLPG